MHSGGERIDILLGYGDDLMLQITDSGTGIDPQTIESGKEGHFGLRGMRERAERIGGRLTVVSSPGSGTVVTLVVPGPGAFQGERP